MHASTKNNTKSNAMPGKGHRAERRARLAPAAVVPTLEYALAVVITVFAFASLVLKQREADQDTGDVDGEILYYKISLTLGGFAAGCWTFVLLTHFAM